MTTFIPVIKVNISQLAGEASSVKFKAGEANYVEITDPSMGMDTATGKDALKIVDSTDDCTASPAGGSAEVTYLGEEMMKASGLAENYTASDLDLYNYAKAYFTVYVSGYYNLCYKRSTEAGTGSALYHVIYSSLEVIGSPPTGFDISSAAGSFDSSEVSVQENKTPERTPARTVYVGDRVSFHFSGGVSALNPNPHTRDAQTLTLNLTLIGGFGLNSLSDGDSAEIREYAAGGDCGSGAPTIDIDGNVVSVTLDGTGVTDGGTGISTDLNPNGYGTGTQEAGIDGTTAIFALRAASKYKICYKLKGKSWDVMSVPGLSDPLAIFAVKKAPTSLEVAPSIIALGQRGKTIRTHPRP